MPTNDLTLKLLLAACCLGLLLSAPALADDRNDSPPNIVFIMADDLGYGALGCYGQTKINTPRIDRMAAEGMRFTQCYAGSHVCQPSRSVLMTGLHTGNTPERANDIQQFLRPQDTTVAKLLQENGYATGGFGKWGLGFEGTPGHPNLQGFDEFFGQYLQVHAHFYYPYWLNHNDGKHMLPGNEDGKREQYVQDAIHEQAIEFIRENHDGPFFAYLPYIIPHVELVVPEESEEPYRGQFPKISIQDPRAGYIGSEDGLTTLAGMISRLDAQVGEVLDLLVELDIDDNTIIIFTSDNGAQSGGKDKGWTKMTDYFEANGPLRGYKGTFYEGGLRVPFIARWPGKIPAGTTSDHICGFWDMLPTFCDLAGIEAPAETDGISIAPSLTGSGIQRQHLGIYWEYARRNGIGRAARMGDWKAVQANPKGPVELYDLSTDIGERWNVADRNPAIVRQMIAFMDGAHTTPREITTDFERTSVKDYVR
ncbi:MAG: arylsulfatase [Maioricimonas sp. JB049]